MNDRINGRKTGSALTALAICAMYLIFGGATAAAQDEYQDDLAAPPPLKTLSKDERSQLEKAGGPRVRTDLALKLMNVRLGNAETLSSRKAFDEAFVELGAFHALMDDALDYLGAHEEMNRRVLTNFKRFEIGIRKFNPRLELIRREFPLTHEYYVRSLLEHLRDARTRATEPLFGDTVLRDNSDM